MRHLLTASILALSLALPSSVHAAEDYFRLNMTGTLFFTGAGEDGAPGVQFVVDGHANPSAPLTGRLSGDLMIPISVNGMGDTDVIVVNGLPDGATWDGEAIHWASTDLIVGTHTPSIEVRDADGTLIAGTNLDIVIYPHLQAALPKPSFEADVGDDLTIAPSVDHLIGSALWGSTPSDLPDWLDFDPTTGEISIDTSGPNSLEGIVLTAVDQDDLASASTAPFSVAVIGACDAWNSATAAEANAWYSVAYGNGQFVAVAGSGTNRVMTSTDGVTWTPRAAAEANPWYSVTYGNGQFVAVAGSGANRVMTSPDGVTWTPRAAAEANTWNSVAYGAGRYVAVASVGTNRVMTSLDGVTWTAATAAEANNWRSVTYGNGKFVAVANNGTNRVMTSIDGVAWTSSPAAEANSWYGVTYANGQFVAVSSTGTNQVMTSPDGVTWTPRAAAEANNWQSVVHGNGKFVAVANSGTNRVMTSPDGVVWTAAAAPEANSWYSVAYGNGIFAAVASTGANRVMTSNCN